MPTSRVIYKGELRTECIHLKSGQIILTDAPTDNQGKGEAFSPTDLTATSLATCILTTIGIVAGQGRLPELQMQAEVTKTMSSDSPRRITRIDVAIETSGRLLSIEEKNLLERVAKTCPVAHSLHPDIEQVLSFAYIME